MLLTRITVLLLLLVSCRAIPSGYVDRDEQQFIDHLLLNAADSKSHSPPAAQNRGEPDELEREQLLSHAIEQDLVRADESKNSEQYKLIKRAAVAIVRRLSMPSPPKTEALIDKAVQFVLKKSMSEDYAKIRSGIKELVEEMLFKGSERKNKPELPKQKTSILREEKILTTLEEILSELATQLNLTTVQIKAVVNTTVDVLAKHFGLKPWQIPHLHERVSSHVRAKLNYQDLVNKDARLRKLEERIEMDIEHLKLNAEQSKRLEALMVEEEALKEDLSRKETLRMLKRVIADVKDDFKTEQKEQESGVPKLTPVDMISIKNAIREKAAEMQLRKNELKVLALAILTAFDDLLVHTSPTTKTQGTQPMTATLQAIKAADTPATVTRKMTATEAASKSPTFSTTTKNTEIEENSSKKPTENPSTEDELEEELEGTHAPEHTTRATTTRIYKTTPNIEHITNSRQPDHENPSTEDELEEELEGTHPPEHTTRATSTHVYKTTPTTEHPTSSRQPEHENPSTEDELEEELEGTHAPEHTTRATSTHVYKTTPTTEHPTSSRQPEHENPSTDDELEEELEGTHAPKHTTRATSTHVYKTTPTTEHPTSSRQAEHEKPSTEDELEEELEGTHPPEHTIRATSTHVYKTTPTTEHPTSSIDLEHGLTAKSHKATTPNVEPSPEVEEDIDTKLAADEADLEGKATKEFWDSNNVDAERKEDELELELERRDQHDNEPENTENPTTRVTMATPSHVTKSATVSQETSEKTISKANTMKGKSKTEPIIVTEVTKPTEAVTHSIPATEDINKELEEELLEGRVTMPTTSHHKEVTQHETKRVGRVTAPTSHAKEVVTQPKTEGVTIPTIEKDLAMELNSVADEGVHSRRHRVKIMEDEDEMEDLKIEKDKMENESTLEDEDLSLSGKPRQNKLLEDELNEVLVQKDAEKDNRSLEDELNDLNYG